MIGSYIFVNFKHNLSKLFPKTFHPDVVIQFFVHISALLKAGFDIVSALNIFIESCNNKRLKSILTKIKSDLQNGMMFSESITQYKFLFTSYMVISLKVAELTGTMPGAFENLANYLASSQRFRRKVSGSLRYPLLLIIIMVVFLIIIGNFFLPNIENNILVLNVGGDHQPEQYLTTKILISVLDFFNKYGMLLVISNFLFGLIILLSYKRSYRFKFLLQSMALKIPLVGYWINKITMHKFAKIFALMLNNHCDVLASLKCAVESVQNIPILLSLQNTVVQVQSGQKLSVAVYQSGFANNVFYNYLKMGEQTGKLKPILAQYVDFESENIERKLNTIATLTPNIVMLFIGLILFWIVAATILPIYDSIGNLDI